jgi:steroid delta-isomerase-like uncharacterized protein
MDRKAAMTMTLTEAQPAAELVRIACEHVDAFSSGEWGIMRAALASDARYDELGSERLIEGPGKIVELFRGWKRAFPDATGTVASAFSSGDRVALEVIWQGTHAGPLGTPKRGVPPTGRQQVTPATFFFSFEGDKIKESRQHFDSMTSVQQIVAPGRWPAQPVERGEDATSGSHSRHSSSTRGFPSMPVARATARSSFRRRFGAFIGRHFGARSFTRRRRSVFG